MLGNEAGKGGGDVEDRMRRSRSHASTCSGGECAGAAGVALRAVVPRKTSGFFATSVRGDVTRRFCGRITRARCRTLCLVVMQGRNFRTRHFMGAQSHPHSRHTLQRKGKQQKGGHQA